MFTLIPQEQKNKLVREYHLRLLFVFISMLALISTISFVFLLPAYLNIKISERNLIVKKNILDKSIEIKIDQDLEKTLSELKNNIEVLQTPERNIFPVIGLVTESKISGITLNKFSYNFFSNGSSTLEISGIASSRKDLLLFSKNLEANEEFYKVDLPISNLAKDSNIDFDLTIVGDF